MFASHLYGQTAVTEKCLYGWLGFKFVTNVFKSINLSALAKEIRIKLFVYIEENLKSVLLSGERKRLFRLSACMQTKSLRWVQVGFIGIPFYSIHWNEISLLQDYGVTCCHSTQDCMQGRTLKTMDNKKQDRNERTTVQSCVGKLLQQLSISYCVV